VRAVEQISDPNALTRGEVTPVGAVPFCRAEGNDLHDLIGTTYAVLDVVSDRAVRVLEEGEFTGWTTYAVEIRESDGATVGGYHGLAITGRCGPIDDSLSPIAVLPPPVPTCEAMPHRMGLLFAPETWDHSDLFTPEGTAFVLMTHAVRDAPVDAGVTNIDLTPLTDVQRLMLDEG
jgi:hypothetical protein